MSKMNEFTKEELIALKNGIEYLPERVNLDNKYQEMCNRIISKIKSMIDNYCEHYYTSVGNHKWLHCIKCKHNFNYGDMAL
jgi:UDP-2,3-diacylglucosamine pyrophosphatase LpxH